MNVKLTSHKKEALAALDSAVERSLEMIGIKGEKYAKALAPVGTPESTGIPGYRGGTLRNSVSHASSENSAYIGTNVEYAPYQELGFTSVAGRHIPAANGGKGYLRPAVQEHIEEYKRIVENEMKR